MIIVQITGAVSLHLVTWDVNTLQSHTNTSHIVYTVCPPHHHGQQNGSTLGGHVSPGVLPIIANLNTVAYSL